MLDPTLKAKDGSTTTPATEDLSQTSAAEKLTSSIELEKQYAGADVKKLVQDALSADGREQKDRAEAAETENKRLKEEVSTVTGQVSTITNQMADLTRAQNESEAAALKDNPEALTSLRVKQSQAAEKIRLDGVVAANKVKEAAFVAREAAAATRETQISIKLAAMASGVDETKLAELVPDGDAKRLASAAALLKAQAAPEIDPVTGKPKVPVTTPKPPGLGQKPASVQSAGGEIRSTAETMLDKAKAK